MHIDTPAVIDYEFFTARLRVTVDSKKKSIPDRFYRPTDEDNARGSMKAFQDYLKNTGRIPDDRAKYVRRGKDQVWGDKESKGEYGVRVTIRKASIL